MEGAACTLVIRLLAKVCTLQTSSYAIGWQQKNQRNVHNSCIEIIEYMRPALLTRLLITTFYDNLPDKEQCMSFKMGEFKEAHFICLWFLVLLYRGLFNCGDHQGDCRNFFAAKLKLFSQFSRPFIILASGYSS